MTPRILILVLFPAVVLAGRNDKREEIIAAAKAGMLFLSLNWEVELDNEQMGLT